ncbi:MAG: peroxiredoxin [Gammaproteobacteria bacterium]|nr:peroxiredoxin [Gammaproteobacteria bacterium]MDE2249824.1 peroxiredoxin [Gammaproteobacteria bacterium]
MNASLVSRVGALLFALALPLLAAAEPATGSMAPNFRLQDQHDAWISLADQRGKWLVVYFYPMDETPGCTTEACEFRDNIFAFRKLGVNVLGISVQDVASKKEFATKHSLPFSVLADADKSVAKAYGVLSVLGYARRETFVIDPQGRIAKHYPDVDPKAHSKQLLADLQTLVKPAS